LGDVRIEDVLPPQRALVVAGLIEKPISHLRLCPVKACTRKEGRPSVCRQISPPV
jgi:hypothetical protein